MRCSGTFRLLQGQQGSIMLIALIFMVLLTLIGMVAANTSTLETMIASADANKRGAFYAAEAGVDHAVALLKPLFIANNQSQLAIRVTKDETKEVNLSWSFALNGSAGVASAKTPTTNSGWRGKFDAGAPWITDYNLGNGYSYSVRVWNNNDGYGATTDNDATVIIGALATGPSNTRAAIEVSLFGDLTNISPAITYTAQAGGGSGKNYNASDVGAISQTNVNSMISAGSP
uniref:Type 4 fimbrial biogenesis protein PilX N-terminal domain-containing protein n=1 Tax=Anaerolinea thermolimosa TaxID=229919 RepID=A0A7C4KFD2_9CHLR